MIFIYAIKSTIKDYVYVGMTENLERRLNQHNKGWNKSTKPYIPFELIYCETYSNRLEARKAEKYYKSAAGKRRLKKGIGNK